MTREEAKDIETIDEAWNMIDEVFDYFEAQQKELVVLPKKIFGFTISEIPPEYQNINQFAFSEWMEYKKYKNKGAITKTLNMLNKYSYEVQQEMVDKSIMNEYKGLFEPKNSQQPQSFKQQDAQKTENALDAFLDARAKGFDLRNVNSENVQDVEVIER